MATIGLDKLYYAKITEDASGMETYDTPVQLAKAITAELSVELAEAILYADDGASEIVKDVYKRQGVDESFFHDDDSQSRNFRLRLERRDGKGTGHFRRSQRIHH